MGDFVGELEDQTTGDLALARVTVSPRGVELECEPAFVLSPERALALAELLVKAARQRWADERVALGAITDPARLADLVPVPKEARKGRLAR